MGSFNDSANTSYVDFIDDGYAKLQSNSFGAHVELEAVVTITDSHTDFNYTAPLPAINFTPFQVPLLLDLYVRRC